MRARSTYLVSVAVLLTIAQVAAQPDVSSDLRTVVEAKLNVRPGGLASRCPIYEDWVAARVFVEYGAEFLAEKPAVIPSKCIVESDAELAAVWQFMNSRTAKIGTVTVMLQEPALNALIEARADATKRGLSITPRGGSIASTRSYANTVDLWKSRFEPGLNYWVRQGRIKLADAAAARKLSIRKQVEAVLNWEQNGMYFSKDLSKSILYSVAIPGASQHNFMLAVDIEQYGNPTVRQILADHGWFQTVKSDLPHFTYLGLKEADLTKNGLKPVMVSGQKFWVPNVNDQRQ